MCITKNGKERQKRKRGNKESSNCITVQIKRKRKQKKSRNKVSKEKKTLKREKEREVESKVVDPYAPLACFLERVETVVTVIPKYQAYHSHAFLYNC